MKATLRDYVLSGITISIVMLVTLGIVWLLRPWTLALLGDYHVLIDVLLALGFYGVISAIVVRVLLRLKPIPPGTYDAGSWVFSYWMLLTVVYRMGEGALGPSSHFSFSLRWRPCSGRASAAMSPSAGPSMIRTGCRSATR